MDIRPIEENSGNFPILRKNYCLVGHFSIIGCGLGKSSSHNKIGLDESNPYNLILVESDKSSPYNQQLTPLKSLQSAVYILKIPTLYSGTGALRLMDMAKARASLVSKGSRMPSSQSLAVLK